MNRDLLWVGIALTATFGGAYLNEKYNLANPELEKKLVGCWAGSTDHGSFMSGATVLQINADGSFSETGIEKFLDKPKFVNGTGTWKLHKDRLTLSYDESTATVLFPRARESLKLIVKEVTETAITAKTDYSASFPYHLSRFPVRDGSCQVQS
jgi:hypothetical protein